MSVPANSVLTYNRVGDHSELCMDDVPLAQIASSQGTPAYVYSANYMRKAVDDLQQAFAGTKTHIHYAVKANSNLAVLRLMHELGCGFDIVSGGELTRVLAAGADASQVVFSGVGKSIADIDFALKAGIACFNVESLAELTRLEQRAEIIGRIAPVSVRVNPNVDAQTHPYISTGLAQNKFGVTAEVALTMYQHAADAQWLDVRGIDCHIGSQIGSIEPLLDCLVKLLELTDTLKQRGIDLDHIDLGGGMGVTYQDEAPLDIQAYGAGVGQLLSGRDLQVILEPGRSMVANAGVLLTQVEYLKPAAESGAPNFAVVDAAMNDLIRPALYQAWHDVVPVQQHNDLAPELWDVVGPVCETGDFLARERTLCLQGEGDLLAVLGAGAYGFVQASNYNSRGRPCEILVDGDAFHLVRRRETIADQLRMEESLPEQALS